MKIYNFLVFILLFIFGLAKNIGRYSLSDSLFFLQELHFSTKYIFFLPYIFLFIIPILDKDWKNRFFLIPVVFGNSIFGGTLSIYLLCTDIINHQYEFVSLLLYSLMILIGYVIGYFLYQKRLWAYYIYLMFSFLFLIISISLHFINVDNQPSDDILLYILPPILIFMIGYFYLIIKKWDIKLNKSISNGCP